MWFISEHKIVSISVLSTYLIYFIGKPYRIWKIMLGSKGDLFCFVLIRTTKTQAWGTNLIISAVSEYQNRVLAFNNAQNPFWCPKSGLEIENRQFLTISTTNAALRIISICFIYYLFPWLFMYSYSRWNLPLDVINFHLHSFLLSMWKRGDSAYIQIHIIGKIKKSYQANEKSNHWTIWLHVALFNQLAMACLFM